MTGCIDLIIPPRMARISAQLSVRRILPYRLRRMVGPFCFLDHMGPHTLNGDDSADVGQHPHIGLSTLTYLFGGCITHRDSLGSMQPIRPGDVNWMTAGRGIVHSERIDPATLFEHPRLHGLQAWVALPAAQQECAPSFQHVAQEDVPQIAMPGVAVSLIAGSALGHESPVRVSSPLFYLKLAFVAGGSFAAVFPGQEAALYLVSGSVVIDDQTLVGPTMVVFRPDSPIRIDTIDDALGILLGGDPMPEGRSIFWNFVSTDKALIDRAADDWRHQRFAMVPGESGWIALPEPHA